MPPQKPDRTLHGYIVLVALLQGAALYAAQLGIERGWWPLSQLGGRVGWYALALAVPATMILTVQDLRDRRYWQQVLGIVMTGAALAAWAAWNASGAPAIDAAAVLVPFGCTLTVALFVLLPYLQCRLRHGRWTAPYAELFEHGWHNGLTLLLVLPFVGLCWGLLWLWGALFQLVRVGFFAELFADRAFVYLATAVMAGLAMLVARTQQRPVQLLQQIVFAVSRGLLPLLGFVALLFLSILPFTGLEPLWQTRRAAALLMAVVVLMLLLTNAVFQDGRPRQAAASPYPELLQRQVELGLVILPVYALLALYALWLRVDQHGWTPQRLYSALLAVVLAAYALGYSYAALRPRNGWLAPLAMINVSLSWLVLLLILLLNSPVLDPYRISVASQLARLHGGEIKPAELDLEFLRFDSGRAGYRALQRLQSDPAMARDPAALAAVSAMLQRTERGPGRRVASEPRSEVARGLTLEQARARIAAAPAVAKIDEAWLRALLDNRVRAVGCLEPNSDCVVLAADMDGDGVAERLLCNLGGDDEVLCRFAALKGGQWADAGALQSAPRSTALVQALREGRFELRPRTGSELRIGDQRLVID